MRSHSHSTPRSGTLGLRSNTPSLKPTTVTSHFQLLSKVSLTLLLLSWRQVTVSDIVLGLCHSHCGTGLGSCAALPRAPRESRDTAAADQRLFHNLCCCCCRWWSFLASGSHSWSYFHSAPSHPHRVSGSWTVGRASTETGPCCVGCQLLLLLLIQFLLSINHSYISGKDPEMKDVLSLRAAMWWSRSLLVSSRISTVWRELRTTGDQLEAFLFYQREVNQGLTDQRSAG